MALESLELEVASLSGIGTEYRVLARDDEGYRLLVSSGPTTRDLGLSPSFRAAVLAAVARIEEEIEDEIAAAEEDETPTNVEGLVAYFEAHPDETNPAAPTPDLYDRLVEKVGRAAAQRVWTEALIAFDRKHAPEEFDDEPVVEKKRFRVSWTTEILDVFTPFDLGDEERVVRVPIAGETILLAADLADALGTADGLVDVDFFSPKSKVSASDPDVLDGRMWAIRPEAPGNGTWVRPGSFDDLGNLLPDVEEWNFASIRITGVREEEG